VDNFDCKLRYKSDEQKARNESGNVMVSVNWNSKQLNSRAIKLAVYCIVPKKSLVVQKRSDSDWLALVRTLCGTLRGKFRSSLRRLAFPRNAKSSSPVYLGVLKTAKIYITPTWKAYSGTVKGCFDSPSSVPVCLKLLFGLCRFRNNRQWLFPVANSSWVVWVNAILAVSIVNFDEFHIHSCYKTDTVQNMIWPAVYGF